MPGLTSGDLMVHAAWVLVAAHLLSAVYELWRATAKAGVSQHDSIRAFLREDLPLYAIAAIVIGLMFAGSRTAAWIGLVFSVGVIVVSTFIYSPRVLPQRQPGRVDWFEVLSFTGLHYVAATMLLYEVTGSTLAR
jgi:hypothetical protein